MFKITSRWPHQNTIKIEWNLSKRCNYDCSYCPAEIHDNVSPHTDIEILKSAVNRLATLNKPLRISFTGGEPCVHPKFKELIDYTKWKTNAWINVTTNGTLPKEFYEKLDVDQYVFSLNYEYDWRRVLSTITHLHERREHKFLVHVMAHHDYMKQVKDTVMYLKEYSMPCAIRRLRWTQGDHDLFDDMRYHPDDLNWIKEQSATVQGNCVIDDSQIIHSNDVIKLHLNKYKDWTCAAGIESLMINWDGDVHRATCRVGGSLGNIYNNTFVPVEDPVTCTRNFCTCSSDIPITKINDKNISN
jgi:MoaA/NifB/PqqE/SkfB family radical SAM enzyme